MLSWHGRRNGHVAVSTASAGPFHSAHADQPIGASQTAGFELHNQLSPKELRFSTPSRNQFRCEIWTEPAQLQIQRKGLVPNEKKPPAGFDRGLLVSSSRGDRI